MDMAYRLVMYILMANVGYMIFSLFRKGYRHYSGYISQLLTLMIMMVFLVAYDVQGGIAIAASLFGIFLIVIVPMFLQRQIDVLMAENRLAEIEPLARWKANLAWSELNLHLHRITQVAEEMLDDPIQLEQEIRKLLDKGEPYDSMTRVFIGLIHFNNRNFEGMVRDLVVTGKSVDEYSFEELLYLVRAYLELTRYEEAIEAQIALEKKIGDPEDYSPEKRANLVISRMIFFAFLGWRDDMEVLMQSQEEGIERLPGPIRDFWKGVCCFNAGSFDEGEKMMGVAMRSCEESEEAENWLPFMRKRFFGLIENREFIASRLVTQLEKLRQEYTQVFNQLLIPDQEFVADQPEKSDCTNILVWVIGIVSSMLMFYLNIEDLVTLIRVGANSSFLVGEGEVFRLFTCLFVHIGWVHLFMNIVALKYFGPPVETVTGWPLFLGIYFFSGLTGSLAAVYSGQVLSAGASSAVLGLLSSAIILEVFKVKGAEKLANQNNFSTLVFILAINLVIGAVEKGVDNSAHLGGLAGGAILSLFLVPVLRHHLLKSLATVISVCFVTVFAGFSIFSLVQYQSVGGYPAKVSHFKSLTNASQTIELELPVSWKIDEQETSFQEISAVGPFRERFSAMFEISDKSSETLIDQHINQRTAELENTPELSLKLRKGPELIEINNRKMYRIKWLINSTNGPVTVVDYLTFEDRILFLLRFFVGTEHDSDYQAVFDRAVKTFKSPYFD